MAISILGSYDDQPKRIQTDAAGLLKIVTLSSALPSGAATQTTLAAILTELGQKLETSDLNIEAVSKDLQVDVKASALPSGAATSAKQDTLLAAVWPHGIWDKAGVIQVLESDEALNASVILYTVPGGKTLYLTSLYARFVTGADAGAVPAILIRDEGDNVIVNWYMRLAASSGANLELNFCPPIVVPTGYDMVAYSPNNNTHAFGSIHGYTV